MGWRNKHRFSVPTKLINSFFDFLRPKCVNGKWPNRNKEIINWIRLLIAEFILRGQIMICICWFVISVLLSVNNNPCAGKKYALSRKYFIYFLTGCIYHCWCGHTIHSTRLKNDNFLYFYFGLCWTGMIAAFRFSPRRAGRVNEWTLRIYPFLKHWIISIYIV